MNRFTTSCTEEQTRKALELGAPIIADTQEIKFASLNGLPFDVDRVVIPTTEQMLGWLRSQGFRFKIEELSDTIVAYRATFSNWYKCGQSNTPNGATHAVIDIALGFLSKIKKYKNYEGKRF